MLQLAAPVWELNSEGQGTEPGPGSPPAGKGPKECLGGSFVRSFLQPTH